MNSNDFTKFGEAMAILAEVFDNGKPVSKIKIDIYFRALQAHRIDSIRAAVSRMVMERVYPTFPKPAEIIRTITGDGQDMALLAWTKVIKAVARTGNYYSVKFSDPVIHSVIEVMGGWIKFGTFREDEMIWKQKEFERYYGIMRKLGSHPSYLSGICETQNSYLGLEHDSEIIRIGFESKPELLTSLKAAIKQEDQQC